MRGTAWSFVPLVAACALALGACSKQADTNPNAPGSPGTGNSAEVVRPAAPDGPPGGPSGIAGSMPHSGASGGDVVPGTTGSGTTETGGRSQTAQPGTGLGGGLQGSNSAVMGSTGTGSVSGVPPGSANTTSNSAVGQR